MKIWNDVFIAGIIAITLILATAGMKEFAVIFVLMAIFGVLATWDKKDV